MPNADQSKVMVLTFTTDQIDLEAFNRAAAHIGVSREELVLDSVQQIVAAYDPESKDYDAESSADWQKQLKEENQ